MVGLTACVGKSNNAFPISSLSKLRRNLMRVSSQRNFLLFHCVLCTAWVPAIFTAFRCAAGPLAGILLDTLGAKGASAVGAALMLVGAVSSIFASQLYHLYFTTTVAGIGAAICCVMGFKLSSIVSAKRTVLASGLAFAGIGVGMIIYAFLGSYVIQETNWVGYYYVLVALSVSTLVAIFFLPASIRVLQSRAKRSPAYRKYGKNGGAVRALCLSVRKFGRSFRQGFALYRDTGFRLYGAALMFYSFGANFPLVFVVGFIMNNSFYISALFLWLCGGALLSIRAELHASLKFRATWVWSSTFAVSSKPVQPSTAKLFLNSN